MFTRNVSMKLKSNSAVEFTRTLEKEIIPLLGKQKGFQGEESPEGSRFPARVKKP